jgi:hypothetical protein
LARIGAKIILVPFETDLSDVQFDADMAGCRVGRMRGCGRGLLHSAPAPAASGARAGCHRAASAASRADWNIFPDPTTGTIDIYHKGEYLGVIDGTEPAEQDPPMPHKSPTQAPPSDQ